MNQAELDEILKLHKKWLNNEPSGKRAILHRADLREADLREADLRGADLRGADLRGADLFRCCLPLWCGGLNIRLDRVQMSQLLYHFCSMQCDDDEVKQIQKSLYKFANEFADSRDDLKNKKFIVEEGVEK